jgi:general secretion pathway protein D
LDDAKRWAATVSAMASEDKVDILSSPSVLASDNKEARINVSTEIPVASTEYTYDSSDSNLLQTNIQYRNTGVILSVTPHINEYGLVSMDVSQEVSEAAEQVDIGNGETRQSFFNRSVNTTLTVKNGQTIVIGGLIRETKSDGVAGLPCLGQVPVLKYLFGRISSSVDKTELIIFITPKVIATLEDVDIVSEEFRKRIDYDYESFKQPGSH